MTGPTTGFARFLFAGLLLGLLLVHLPCVKAADWSRWASRQSLELPEGQGLSKVDLPPSTLGMLQPSFQDLRLIDGAGAELPWALEFPSVPQRVLRQVQGFRVSLEETSTLLLIPLPASGATPEALLLESSAHAFNKALRLEHSKDAQVWSLLQDKVPFTKDSGSSSSISLPAGLTGWLRLSIDDRRSPPVPVDRVFLRLLEQDSWAPTSLSCDLGRVEDLGLESRWDLRFPASGVHLSGLSLEFADPVFRRRARLVQKIFTGERFEERVVVETWLERLPRADSSASVRFPVECRLPSASLVLVIENGDSPALQLRSVTAQARPLRLVFVPPSKGPCYLLGGARQVSLPKYDLASMVSEFRDLPGSPAVFGSVEANPSYRLTEVGPDFPSLGPVLDVSAWSFSKPVGLSHAGVQRLELDSEVLARAADSLSDLRLLRGDQQVPYVLESCSFLRAHPLSFERQEEGVPAGKSRWLIQLAKAGLPVKRLTLLSATSVFSRHLTLFERRRDRSGQSFPVVLGEVRWTRTEQSQAQVTLELQIRPQTCELFLETSDGDNLPLSLERVTAFLPVQRLHFKTTDAQPLTLFYGQPLAPAPSYDLRLVGSQLLASDPSVPTLGPEQALKAAAEQTKPRLFGSSGSWLFWSSILLVVAGLLFVLSKLLPKSNAGQ